MPTFLSLLAVVTIAPFSLSHVDADEPATTREDFAYTEVYTALSDSGFPVYTDVKRVKVSGPHKRIDRFEGRFEVIDALTSRMVSIDPKRKTYTLHEQQRVINVIDGSQTEFDIPQWPAHDHYKALTWMPDGSTHVVLKDELSIDGQLTRGQQATHVSAGGTNVTSIWTGVKSDHVVQVRATWTPKGANRPQVVIIRTAFDYEPRLDPSVFSLVPPSGYELKTQPVFGLTMQRD